MSFISSHTGELAAIITAFCWAFSALFFESASYRIGSIPVNIIRLVTGFIFLSLYTWIVRGMILPTDATAFNWIWLSISGIIGFLFCDLFLFKSYTIIGSRFSMLIMTTVPPITALLSWMILGEKLTLLHYAGMTLTFSGIVMAIFSRENKNEKFKLKLEPRGILFAFLGAVGQASGLVVSKYGMGDYDPFASTQIRIIAGTAGFIVLITYLGRWERVLLAFRNPVGFAGAVGGSLFGPFLGVAFSLIAVSHTQAGIASTIIALTPIIIIPFSVIIFKVKVTLLEIAGSIISVCGVALLFLK